MLVPLGWLREYVDLPADAHRVAEMLAELGFPVESIEERPLITGVVVGRIAQLEKHPNADRLQVGKIDIGDGEPLTIATAATNVAQGQTIPVALIGAQLPQLKIEPRKMRGIESQGMMISAEELALPAEWFEDGIMQLEDDVPLGVNAIDYFRLGEAVLDVEITGNRVDAMSMLGIARELAAYQGLAVREPRTQALEPHGSGVRISVETPDCSRFVLARFENARVQPSPAWMRMRLSLAGQRPINNLVDISNYVMLEMGQPLHFYDAAKVANGHLIVRDGREGENLTTLDGNDRELAAKDLVIATESGPAGLAGLMGGAESEVSGATQSILLEAATFDGPRIRRMSARHALRTEASTRNEKSLPSSFALAGASRAASLLADQGVQIRAVAFAGEEARPAPVLFQLRDVRRLLGFDLTANEVREFLDRLGCAAEPVDEATLRVTPPAWRRDITISADIIEEIARMAGYDRIEPAVYPLAAHEITSGAYELESRIAHTLVSLGYRELVTVSMHGPSVLERLERLDLVPSVTPLEVLNPLSEEQRYLRFAISIAHLQWYARIDRPARAFEIGHVFAQDETKPTETAQLLFGFTAEPQSEPPWRDSHFLRIKADTEALLHSVCGAREIEWAADTRNGAHPGKTAVALIAGREVAVICQVDPRLCKAFEVRLPVYGAWIYLERIPEYHVPKYEAPSKYPGTYRDLALTCDFEISASSIERVIARAVGRLCTGVRAFDEYRGPQVGENKKSLAVRITMVRTDATITDEEADAAVQRALAALRDELGIELRA